MQISLLLVGIVCFMGQVANAQKLQKEIVGYWTLAKIDIQSSEYDKLNDEEKQQFDAFKQGMMEGMEAMIDKAFFDFKKDGSMTLFDEEKGTGTGKWSISGNTLKIKEEKSEEGQEFIAEMKNKRLVLTMKNSEMPGMAIFMEMKKR